MRSSAETADSVGVPDEGRRRGSRPRFLMQVAGAAAILAALAGCAGARVTDVASAKHAGPPPAEILVDVSAAPTSEEAQTNLAREVAAKLQLDVIQRLTAARFRAEPFVPGTSHPEAAVLRISVIEAEPGSELERLVVGFGLGRAELQTKVDLQSMDSSGLHAMAAFNASSATGRFMPGLVLPASIALATRNLIPLAVGGSIKVATSLRGGLDGPAQRTAAAVVAQLKEYYASVGWHWPADAET